MSDHFNGDLHSSVVPLLRRGDIVGANGFPCRTKRGELTLNCNAMTLLSPCLRVMANQHTELQNVDKRFRRRHVDFLVGGGERREVLKTRHKVFRAIRQFLDDEGND